jgi:hypothetical protein
MAVLTSLLQAPQTSRAGKRRKQVPTSTHATDHRITLAQRLDVMAGCELQHGHHLAAEHLARRAQALREARL